ncbi:MAG: hypothetical protein F4213_06035 [Boseongicola sp. SB0677_bin_26]|nr:hypothetical protein [Boseongicola sp. SB0665_bin_10]MYG25568.1 hypothetical protein [Boseongicola sp. SB0677_bin_26]
MTVKECHLPCWTLSIAGYPDAGTINGLRDEFVTEEVEALRDAPYERQLGWPKTEIRELPSWAR